MPAHEVLLCRCVLVEQAEYRSALLPAETDDVCGEGRIHEEARPTTFGMRADDGMLDGDEFGEPLAVPDTAVRIRCEKASELCSAVVQRRQRVDELAHRRAERFVRGLEI